MDADPLSYTSLERLHTSFSQISCYLRCSEQFRFRYVLGAQPSHRSGELVFGSCVHGALAWYHQELQRTGRKPSLALVLDEFATLWAVAQQGPMPILWPDDDSIESLSDKATKLIELYADTHSVRRIIAVEKEFSIPLVDPATGKELEERLDGFVDVIEEDLDGRIWITELKTSARKFDESRLSYDHQPNIYLFARLALDVPDAGVRFRVLLKSKVPRIETHELNRDSAQLAETTNVVTQVLRAIDHRIFFPNRGWQCAACSFRYRCGG